LTDRFLEALFLLFGRKLAKVPPFPVDGDGIKFNFALNQWELAPFGGAGEANTSSNVGAGAGWALPKVGVDLPFKSFIALSPLLLTINPNDITISLTGGVVPSFLMNAHNNQTVTSATRFSTIVGIDIIASVEVNRQNIFPNACTLKRMSVEITSQRNDISSMTLRINTVDGNQTISIPASTTGKFQDLTNTDSIANTDLLDYKWIRGGNMGDLDVNSTAIEVVA